MDCREARDRLVALQDAELSPGETVQVTEHLDGCPDCAARERRLARATPRARLVVPPAAQAFLEDRVDADVILALAERQGSRWSADRPGPAARLVHWMRRDTRVSAASLVAYAALLALAVGWGLSSWWSLSTLRSADHAGGPSIPADQFAPASYESAQAAPDAVPPRAEPHVVAPDADAGASDGPSGEAEGGGFH